MSRNWQKKWFSTFFFGELYCTVLHSFSVFLFAIFSGVSRKKHLTFTQFLVQLLSNKQQQSFGWCSSSLLYLDYKIFNFDFVKFIKFSLSFCAKNSKKP